MHLFPLSLFPWLFVRVANHHHRVSFANACRPLHLPRCRQRMRENDHGLLDAPVCNAHTIVYGNIQDMGIWQAFPTIWNNICFYFVSILFVHIESCMKIYILANVWQQMCRGHNKTFTAWIVHKAKDWAKEKTMESLCVIVTLSDAAFVGFRIATFCRILVIVCIPYYYGSFARSFVCQWFRYPASISTSTE